MLKVDRDLAKIPIKLSSLPKEKNSLFIIIIAVFVIDQVT